MDINSLRYFVVFGRSENISHAADELHITQQGLSRSIQSLSNEIGVPLTERLGTTVILTPFGRMFLEYAQNTTQQHDALLNRLSTLKQIAQGTVELGFALGVNSFLGFDLLKEFFDTYPGINVEEREHEDRVVERMILTGELDIGFTIHAVDSLQFNSRLLKSGPYFLICHQDHPLAQKKTCKFKDLKKHDFLTLTNACKSTTELVKRCRENGFEPTIRESSKEIIVLWEQCLDNRGIFISSSGRLIKEKFNKDGSLPLKVIPIDKEEDYLFDVYMITKKNHPTSWPTQLLQDYIRSRFPRGK